MFLKQSTLLGLAAVFFLTAGISVSLAAESKVGFINLQRLVNESELGKAARKEIAALRKQKEADVAKKLGRINMLKAEIGKDAAKLSAEAKRNKIDQLQLLYKEYQRMVADAKEDIVKEDRELVALILRRADGVLKKVAKKKKFTLILKDPNTIGYLDPEMDITDDVLKELNKKQ